MTTLLTKPVRRRVDMMRGPVIVTLVPGGLVSFREKGRRKSFEMSLGRVFILAVDAEIARQKAERKAARAAKRGAR